MRKQISIKELEEISLEALYQHCPLCGQICSNFYCEKCKFKYEKDKVYFCNGYKPMENIKW